MRTVTAKRAAAILFGLAKSSPELEGVYLVPANACPVVPMSIIKAGRKVEFIDIDNLAYSMNVNSLEKRIEDKSKAPVAGVVFIRTYGAIDRNTVNFPKLKNLSPTTLLVDDRCAAIPEVEENSFIETGADVYLYSTGYAKYVDLGFGGFAHIKSGVTYASDQEERSGFVPADYQILDKLCKSCLQDSNSRLLDLSLVESKSWLDTSPLDMSWSEYKDKVAAAREKISSQKKLADQIYYEIIPDSIFLGAQFNDWRHQILVDHKEELLKKIFGKELFASGHYNTVARIFGSGEFPNSDQLYSRVINLFNDLHINEEQLIEVAETVKCHVSLQ